MTKEEFNELEVIKQLEYVNNELTENKSLRDISSDLKMSKTTFRDRFVKIGYVYNADTKQYYKDNTIVIQLHQNIIKEPQKAQERVKKPIEESKTEELQKYDDDIKELVNYKDDILAMLKNYKSNTNVIEVVTLDINSIPNEMQKDIATKSIKVYEPVYKEFDKVCKSYSSYKKQDLVSIALNEFCNKYKI